METVPSTLETSLDAAQAAFGRFAGEEWPLLGATLMYAVYCYGICRTGIRSHNRKIKRDYKPDMFPKEYFTMLSVQLVPLVITGLARGDVFLTWSRGLTLMCVLVASMLVFDEDGILEWEQYKRKIQAILALLFVGPVLWTLHPGIRQFVQAFATPLGYFSDVAMVFFVIFGQGVALRTVARRTWSGEYQLRGFDLQVWRLLGFGLQMIHYGGTFGFRDPIFLQSAMGALGAGAAVVVGLLGLAWRWLSGPFRRRRSAAP